MRRSEHRVAAREQPVEAGGLCARRLVDGDQHQLGVRPLVRHGLSRSGHDRRPETRGRRQRDVADVDGGVAPDDERRRRRGGQPERVGLYAVGAIGRQRHREAAVAPGHRLAPRLAPRRVVGVGTEAGLVEQQRGRPAVAARDRRAPGDDPAGDRHGRRFAVEHRAGAQRLADRRRQAGPRRREDEALEGDAVAGQRRGQRHARRGQRRIVEPGALGAIARDHRVRRVGGRLRARRDERPLAPGALDVEQIQLRRAETEPDAGNERRRGVVAPEQTVGEVQGVGIRGAVVEIAAHAHAGLAGAQLVAGDDGDAAVRLPDGRGTRPRRTCPVGSPDSMRRLS